MRALSGGGGAGWGCGRTPNFHGALVVAGPEVRDPSGRPHRRPLRRLPQRQGLRQAGYPRRQTRRCRPRRSTRRRRCSISTTSRWRRGLGLEASAGRWWLRRHLGVYEPELERARATRKPESAAASARRIVFSGLSSGVESRPLPRCPWTKARARP